MQHSLKQIQDHLAHFAFSTHSEMNEELVGLFSLALRDFLYSWYDGISADTEMGELASLAVHRTFKRVESRLEKVWNYAAELSV